MATLGSTIGAPSSQQQQEEKKTTMTAKYHRSTHEERQLMLETHAKLEGEAWSTQLAAYNAEAEQRGWYAAVKLSTFHSICNSASPEKSRGKLKAWEEWEDVEVERFERRPNKDKTYKEFIEHMRAKYDPEYSRTLVAFRLRIYALLKKNPRKSEVHRQWEEWEDKELVEWCKTREGANRFDGFVEHIRATHDPGYHRSVVAVAVRYHTIKFSLSPATREEQVPSSKDVPSESGSDVETESVSEASSGPSHNAYTTDSCNIERPAKRARFLSVACETDKSSAGNQDFESQMNINIDTISTVNGYCQSSSLANEGFGDGKLGSCVVEPPTKRPHLVSTACGTEDFILERRDCASQTDTNVMEDENGRDQSTTRLTEVPDVVIQCLNDLHRLLTSSDGAIGNTGGTSELLPGVHGQALGIVRKALLLIATTSNSSDDDTSSQDSLETDKSLVLGNEQIKAAEGRAHKLEKELQHERQKFGEELASLREKFGLVQTTSAKLQLELQNTQRQLEEINEANGKSCECRNTREANSFDDQYVGASDSIFYRNDGPSDRLLALSSILKEVDAES